MLTISDFPVYGMLSGWTTHGRLSCPNCMDDTKSFSCQMGRRHFGLIVTESIFLMVIHYGRTKQTF